jgi:hypothetical protein
MASKVAGTATGLTKAAIKENLPSSLLGKSVIARLSRYFSNPEKVALWTPAVLHIPATAIQPAVTYLQLSRSGVDQDQVNTLTKMETVRSLTSQGLNLVGSIIPAFLAEFYNHNLEAIQKVFRMPNLKKASTLKQLGFIVLANTVLYGLIRPWFINGVAAKTFLKTNSQSPAPLEAAQNNRLLSQMPLSSAYKPGSINQAPPQARTQFLGSAPFVTPALMPFALQSPPAALAFSPLAVAPTATFNSIR